MITLAVRVHDDSLEGNSYTEAYNLQRNAPCTFFSFPDSAATFRLLFTNVALGCCSNVTVSNSALAVTPHSGFILTYIILTLLATSGDRSNYAFVNVVVVSSTQDYYDFGFAHSNLICERNRFQDIVKGAINSNITLLLCRRGF